MQKRFGTTSKTVALWIKQAREQYTGYLSKQSGIDLITNSVLELDLLRRFATDEMRLLREEVSTTDEEGNEVRKGQLNHKAYSEYLKTAAQLVGNKQAFLAKIGAIPTQPEKIHHTITGEIKIQTEESKETEDTRSPEEIQRDITERLEKTRRLRAE